MPAIAAALVTFAPALHAVNPASNVKAAIQLLYDKENIATANKDLDTALADTSKKFIGIDDKGKRTSYHDRLENTRYLVEMSRFVQEGTVVRACNVVGNKATVRVDHETRAVIDGAGSITDSSTSDDTWLRTVSGWRLLYRHTIAHNVTIDNRHAPAVIGPGGDRLRASDPPQLEQQKAGTVAKS